MRFSHILAMAVQQGGGAAAGGGAIIGDELVINSDYSSSSGHTTVNLTIAVNQCTGAGNATQTDQVTSIETLVPGTYRVIIAITATDGADFVYAIVGGTSGGAIPSSNTATFSASVDVVVTNVTDQLLILSAPSSTITLASWSVKRTV